MPLVDMSEHENERSRLDQAQRNFEANRRDEPDGRNLDQAQQAADDQDNDDHHQSLEAPLESGAGGNAALGRVASSRYGAMTSNVIGAM